MEYSDRQFRLGPYKGRAARPKPQPQPKRLDTIPLAEMYQYERRSDAKRA